MLELQKFVLEKVSTDNYLFRKELLKSFAWLSSIELIQLYKWLKDNYYSTHSRIIDDVYNTQRSVYYQVA